MTYLTVHWGDQNELSIHTPSHPKREREGGGEINEGIKGKIRRRGNTGYNEE